MIYVKLKHINYRVFLGFITILGIRLFHFLIRLFTVGYCYRIQAQIYIF